MSAFHREGVRALRRGWPIHGYTGPNGSGKSMAMVWDTLPTLDSGRQVLSTVRLLDFRDPRPCDGEGCSIEVEDHSAHRAAHPLWVPLTRWDQLLEARDCDVLLDEVTGVASSRTTHAMPAAVANLLVQLRRRDVVLRWTAPNWMRADVIIRECTQAVTYCRGYLPKAVQGEDRMWRHRRLGKWLTFDANEFDDFTAGKREQADPLAADWHWIPTSLGRLGYDTFDAVSTIGTVSDAGRCSTCDGTKSRPRCTCDDNKGSRRGGRRGAPAERGADDVPVTPLEVIRGAGIGSDTRTAGPAADEAEAG